MPEAVATGYFLDQDIDFVYIQITQESGNFLIDIIGFNLKPISLNLKSISV